MLNGIYIEEVYAPIVLVLLVFSAIGIVFVFGALKGLNKKKFCSGCEKEFKLKDLLPQNKEGRGGILLCKNCSDKLKLKKNDQERAKKWMQNF